MANELLGSRSLERYRLRDSNLVVYARHPLLDSWVLEEVFRLRVYEPPVGVSNQLRRLERPLRVLDLGGNAGFFGLFVRQLFPDCRVVSFEPDPENAEVLAHAIAANGLDGRWELRRACAATSAGAAPFVSSGPLSRSTTAGDQGLEMHRQHALSVFPFLKGSRLLEERSFEVPAEDAFPFLCDADLVKIDIEGGEWELLGDPRFASIRAPAIVLEYHPRYGPADPYGQVSKALTGAGYVIGPPSEGGDAALVWAWRPGGSTV